MDGWMDLKSYCAGCTVRFQAYMMYTFISFCLLDIILKCIMKVIPTLSTYTGDRKRERSRKE